MKCAKHPVADAIAVCQGCGRGICKECIISADSEPASCSKSCTSRIEKASLATNALQDRSRLSAIVTAVFCIGCGAVFALTGILVWLENSQKYWRLVIFMVLSSMIFIVIGFLYARLARKRAGEAKNEKPKPLA
jgi:hypothetical protein